MNPDGEPAASKFQEDLERLILDYQEANALTIAETIGVLEVVKFDMLRRWGEEADDDG